MLTAVWNHQLLLGSMLVTLGIAGLLLRRDGRTGLVGVGIGWLGLLVLVTAAGTVHPAVRVSTIGTVLTLLLPAYLVLGNGLRHGSPLVEEADDVDDDPTGRDDLVADGPARDWSAELAVVFSSPPQQGDHEERRRL